MHDAGNIKKHIQDLKSLLQHEFFMLFRQEILLNWKTYYKEKYVLTMWENIEVSYFNV